MKSEKILKKAGRPREFDCDQAMDQILDVFWRKGYEGTSISDLTDAVGVNKPSLYAAFGNKQEMFDKALARYGERIAPTYEALEKASAREAIETLLHAAVDFQTNPDCPKGCLAVQAALAGGSEAEPIRQTLIERRTAVEKLIHQRFEQAKTEGEIPCDLCTENLARYFCTLSHGLSVQAASGVSREDLHRVIQTAMHSWPTSVTD